MLKKLHGSAATEIHDVTIPFEDWGNYRGVKRKKQNVHPFIVASYNAQSVKGNDMACKRCEISTFIKDRAKISFCD